MPLLKSITFAILYQKLKKSSNIKIERIEQVSTSKWPIFLEHLKKLEQSLKTTILKQNMIYNAKVLVLLFI